MRNFLDRCVPGRIELKVFTHFSDDLLMRLRGLIKTPAEDGLLSSA